MPYQLPSPPAVSNNEPKTLCGWLTKFALSVPSIGGGLVGGIVSAAQGNSFEAGFDDTYETLETHLINPVVDFADKHNRKILTGAATGAAAAAAQIVHKAVSDNPDPDPVGTLATGAAGGVLGGLAAATYDELDPPTPAPSRT